MSDFSKPYNPQETEPRIYDIWLKSGYFTPENLPDAKNRKPFTIILPPPNATGTLHIGHAVMLAIQDTLIRFWRMRGRKTLWLPGTDHAAIATQEKVEKELYKEEKKTRHDLGREEFLRRVDAFVEESRSTIKTQIRKMGCSLDWTREAFTMDAQRSLAVRTAFVRMYDAGLIYRGHRIVNWDPKLQTTVSDDEIEWKEEKTPFYYLTYGPFTIGTARPETKFGDKYVVMHPDDERYSGYTDGQKLEIEWINGTITAMVVKDAAIDMSFGTGVMTITPWHDAADFDIAERHKLDKEQIIDLQGKLLPIAGAFAGEHITKARPKIVDKLKEKGLLAKIDENYIHRIAMDSRGGGTIEPQILEQWFVNVNFKFQISDFKFKIDTADKKISLKEILKQVVESKQIKILPERFEKTYFHWINNLRDWCISRQIWYGHKIPVWYCVACGKNANNEQDLQKCTQPIVSIEDITACPHCGGVIRQDPDTLDTWFSSGLWTFSTLGYPKKTKDLEQYHPTDVLETGYDILFFWVARMILMTGFLLGDIPFHAVYLHGLVRDAQGRKMSKSLGNIIDPLTMSERYGADATRLSFLIGNAPGGDLKMSEDKIRGYRNFANKIWNASRFVITNLEGFDPAATEKINLTLRDKEILADVERLSKEITIDIENFRLYLAAEKTYHYFWHTFADNIIEEVKSRLKGTDTADKTCAQRMLYETLITLLKLLHPFMPFVTEAVWEQIPMKNKSLLLIEQWPTK